MDVQTQVMNEPMQVFTRDEIQNQSVVADYKEALSKIRVDRISIVQQVQGLADEVKELVNSRENLLSMFNAEAVAMYPELKGQNAVDVLSSLVTSHPLFMLWDQYKGKIEETAIVIKDKYLELESLNNAASQLQLEEQATFESYTQFASQATTVVPSPDQILSELQAVEVIPYVEEGSVRADLHAIELLDPTAAAMVTLQTLEVASEGDYSESPEQLEYQGDAQVRSMAPSFDEEYATPSMPQVAAVAPAILAQMEDPALANEKLKKMGMWFGVAAILYLFLGGNKS